MESENQWLAKRVWPPDKVFECMHMWTNLRDSSVLTMFFRGVCPRVFTVAMPINLEMGMPCGLEKRQTRTEKGEQAGKRKTLLWVRSDNRRIGA